MPIGMIINALAVLLGGILILATGFKMVESKMFPTADMIPAIVLVMPLL